MLESGADELAGGYYFVAILVDIDKWYFKRFPETTYS